MSEMKSSLLIEVGTLKEVWFSVLCLKLSTFPLERWVIGEHTLSKRWAHSEWTVSARWMEFGERLWPMNCEWAQSANRAQTKHKVNGEHIITICECKMIDLFIPSASRVILTLCFVGYQEKMTTKLHVCIVISLNIILCDWTTSERWKNGEWKVNALWTPVSAQWALCDWWVWTEHSGERMWTHSVRTVSAQWMHGKMRKWNVS